MDIKNHYTEMTADKVNIDKCICDLDLAASKRHDCEAIRKHIREIRRIFAGIPEEPAQRTQSVVDAAMRDIEEKSKAFTAAHQEESSEEILSEMRGEESVSEDLEKEIERWVYSPYFDLDGVAVKGATHYLTVEDVADIARQFAEWGKETMRKQYAFINLQDAKEAYHEWLKSQDIPHAGAAWIRACQWQKEQMLKDAVETSVKRDAGGYPYIPAIELYDYNENKPLAKEGDKVKVIIIK